MFSAERLPLTGNVALACAVAIGLLWGFWSYPLVDLDEGAFTEATREMLTSGNYVSIYLNGEPRNDKPIMIYWLQAASVKAFGLNEFALRLPSVIAALAWLAALVRFAARHTDRATARVAGVIFALSLAVGIIGRAATADALLNVLIVLSMFAIYDHFHRPDKKFVYLAFFWMGLGFLTKGPVAVLFPLLVSLLFYFSYGRWRDWLRAALNPLGLVLFVLIVLPWHIALYLDSGWEFFRGFYLGHNLDRYQSAMEGHSGGAFYYVLIAPLLLLPFSGWFIAIVPQIKQSLAAPLERFAWIWFVCVLAVFSFSGTKLPHYMLYGISGMILVMAIRRDSLKNNVLAFALPLLFLGLLVSLPQLFALLAEQAKRTYEQLIFNAAAEAFSGIPQWVAIGAFLLSVGWVFAQGPIWRRLMLIGYTQAALLAFLLGPTVISILQDGPKAAALYAKSHDANLVFYRTFQPSVSVYSEQIIPRGTGEPGQWVYLRSDRLEEFLALHPEIEKRIVFEQVPAALVELVNE